MTSIIKEPATQNVLQPVEQAGPKIQANPSVGLEDVALGRPMAYRGITLIPLFLPRSGDLEYLDLNQALKQQVFGVAEMDLEGVVPELMVENSGHQPVLLMNGEELLGIKQNRVLSTSVMVPAKTQMPIPVSCVEQHRWEYSDSVVTESDNLLERTIRAEQMNDVNRSLEANGTFHPDQNLIWFGVLQLIEKAGTYSAHSAMRDVFQQKRIKLNRCCKAFPLQPGQNGMLALRENKPLGLDLVSRPEVYQNIHCKLVKSYVLDSLLEKPRRAIARDRATAIAGELLTQANEAKPKRFNSLGHGKVLQVDTNGMIGSVLIHEEAPIHATILAKQKIEQMPPVDYQFSDFLPIPDFPASTHLCLIDDYCDTSQ